MRTRRLIACLTVACGLLAAAGPARAHFAADSHNRTIIVAETDAGLALYLRVPAPLAYAEALSRRVAPGDAVSAPFLRAEEVRGAVAHYLDRAATAADPEGFGAFVAAGYEVQVDGEPQPLAAVRVRVHDAASAPPFATPVDARGALSAAAPTTDDPFVGDAVIDAEFLIPGGDAGAALAIRSVLPELELPPGILIDNHVIDFRGGEARFAGAGGQLIEPVALEASAGHAATAAAVAGFERFLLGPGHALFALCLAVAATSAVALLWQAAAFMIAHSAALIMCFLVVVPGDSPWLEPATGAAIAASVAYPAILALIGRIPRSALALTAALGLVHGFGFALVLRAMAEPRSPHARISLLSFNAGLEIAQLAIMALAFVVLLAASRLHFWSQRAIRWAVGGLSIAAACVLAIERATALT